MFFFRKKEPAISPPEWLQNIFDDLEKNVDKWEYVRLSLDDIPKICRALDLNKTIEIVVSDFYVISIDGVRVDKLYTEKLYEYYRKVKNIYKLKCAEGRKAYEERKLKILIEKIELLKVSR